MNSLMVHLADPETNEWFPFPTVYEFAQYLLDEIPQMGDVLNVNRHFAAQYTQCPFCSIPFDAIGRKETFENDVQILFENVKLAQMLNGSLKQNSASSFSNEDEATLDFFKQLPRNLSEAIFEYYELDFDMFGYNKTEAMKYIDASQS